MKCALAIFRNRSYSFAREIVVFNPRGFGRFRGLMLYVPSKKKDRESENSRSRDSEYETCLVSTWL